MSLGKPKPLILTRPTASFILAQGTGLGYPAQETTQPEGLPHHPAKRHPTSMQQAFSLQSIFHLLPQGVTGLGCGRPLASKSAAPLNTAGGRHRPLTYYQTGGGAEIDFVIETRKRQPGGKPRVVCLEVKHAPCRTIRFSCSNFQSKRS